MQAEIPNHRKLRRLRAGVVSVAVEVPRVAGQVCDEKTNVCEPLLTHRRENGGIETGSCGWVRDKGVLFGVRPQPGSGLRVASVVSGV